MHSAPSVSFPVGRSRLARRWLWSAWGLGALSLLAWCVQFDGPPWRTAVLAAAVVMAAAGAWRASRLGEGAQLNWNGQAWSSSGQAGFGHAMASVQLDLQSLMLVRLHEPGRGATWLWLERAAFPARWLDLRRALHASSDKPAKPSGETSSGTSNEKGRRS